MASISEGKEEKDFVSSLEVSGTHNAFPQSIVNNSFNILHSIYVIH